MNKIGNRYLLAGDELMPELHLRQPRYTHSTCGPFTKYWKRIKKFRETGNLDNIYMNKLGEA